MVGGLAAGKRRSGTRSDGKHEAVAGRGAGLAGSSNCTGLPRAWSPLPPPAAPENRGTAPNIDIAQYSDGILAQVHSQPLNR